MEEVEEDTVSKELTKPEMSINLNDALHQCYINPNRTLERISFLQTRVKAHKYGCGVWLLDFAMKIHYHKAHSLTSVDSDEVDEMVK